MYKECLLRLPKTNLSVLYIAVNTLSHILNTPGGEKIRGTSEGGGGGGGKKNCMDPIVQYCRA